jgi:DNA invertase Pin-like site-specific DNA recombinase
MIIGYARISVADNLNDTSLITQEGIIKNYCETHSLKLDRFYSEITSGTTPLERRPVLSKALKELKKGDVLITTRLCRLSRRLLSTLNLIETFKNEHKELIICDLGNVHKDSISKILISVLSMVSEIERENVVHRVKLSKEQAKRENKYRGGYMEFGWKKNEEGKLEPNEKELEIFKSIINLRRNKLTVRKISEVIRNTTGKKLHYSFVAKLLQREHNFKILNEPLVA